jgi:hypothetical protein
MTTKPEAPPIDNLAAPPTDEPGIFPVRPEDIPSEQLARLIVDRFNKFKEFLPYIKELRKRFAELPRGNANIAGCKTWTQFCTDVLGRTDSAVRKALALNEPKQPAVQKLLLAALRRIVPVCINDDGDAPIRFSISENGNLLLTGEWRGEGASEEIPEARFLKPGGPGLFAGDFGVVNLSSEPFDFEINALHLLDALKYGDPTIVYRGLRHNVMFEFREHFTVYIMPRGNPTPLKPLSEEKYKGEFLPDLKPGHEVVIEIKGSEQFLVVAVTLVTWQFISVVKKSGERARFDRDGTYDGLFHISRIATDEDKKRSAEWEAQRAAEKETEDAANTAKVQRVRELINRLPRNIQFVDEWRLYATGVHLNLTHITIEQLEQIVEALQPDPFLVG